MSYSYDRYERQRRQTYGTAQRTAWGYWIPLVLTVTVATAGLAAWIWSETRDDEDGYRPRPPPSGYDNAPPPQSTYDPPTPDYGNAPSSGFGSVPPGQTPYAGQPGTRQTEEESLVTRMSGALRRTPSPQQIFDGASRTVAAGVAAAGAAVGGALSSIREEDKSAYEDHSRWSEEADSQNGGASRKGLELRDTESPPVVRQVLTGAEAGGKRKTVAIVMSAKSDYDYEEEASFHQEYAVCPPWRLH